MSRLVDDWIEGYLQYTENTEPSSLYRRWVAISVMAAVLQRKCWLNLGIETFYPNFYIVLVGPPAARKGTAIGPGREFLDTLGVPLAADESSRQKLVAALQNAAVAEPTETGVNYHASLTIISSELTVFLGYQDIALLTYLCDWYDCRNRFVHDTFSRGWEEVANVWVNLLGATTPALLQSSLPEGAVGSGFTSRTLFIYSADKEKVVYIPDLSEEQEALGRSLLQDLEYIRAISGKFVLSPEAVRIYISWRKDAESNRPFSDPRLEFYTQRRQVHLLKLALVYSASHGDSRVISEDDMAKAIWTLEDAETVMPEVFAGVGTNPLAAAQMRLMRLLAVRGTMSTAEIAQLFFNDASSRDIGDMLASLEQMGYCQIDVRNKRVIYTRKERENEN